jgi:hypothetical protein
VKLNPCALKKLTVIFFRRVALLVLCIVYFEDYKCQGVNLTVCLNANSTIEVKFANNSLKKYIFLIDTSYIGIYEEDISKLWFEITDILDKPVLKYNSMVGFRVFPSDSLGQIWQRNSEIKDSTNRAIAYSLNKSKGFILHRKSKVRLNFKFKPDIYERLPEEARDDVCKYILKKGEKYKARVVYSPDINPIRKNKQVYSKKLFSNYFYFTY